MTVRMLAGQRQEPAMITRCPGPARHWQAGDVTSGRRDNLHEAAVQIAASHGGSSAAAGTGDTAEVGEYLAGGVHGKRPCLQADHAVR